MHATITHARRRRVASTSLRPFSRAFWVMWASRPYLHTAGAGRAQGPAHPGAILCGGLDLLDHRPPEVPPIPLQGVGHGSRRDRSRRGRRPARPRRRTPRSGDSKNSPVTPGATVSQGSARGVRQHGSPACVRLQRDQTEVLAAREDGGLASLQQRDELVVLEVSEELDVLGRRRPSGQGRAGAAPAPPAARPAGCEAPATMRGSSRFGVLPTAPQRGFARRYCHLRSGTPVERRARAEVSQSTRRPPLRWTLGVPSVGSEGVSRRRRVHRELAI